jgi:hypothetical protein
MNAGRDIERTIAGWLIEEAPGRAPDRILDSTAKVIDRTKQRRFGAVWRALAPVPIRGLAAAAAIGVVVVLVALSVIALDPFPSNGVGRPPAPAAGPIPDGKYVSLTLRVVDIVASINANPTLSDAERRDVLQNVLGVGDGETFFVSIDILMLPGPGNGQPSTRQWIVRHTVDGVTRADVATGCHFEDDRLVVGGFFLAIDAFDVVRTGDGFTLSVLQSQATEAEEAAAQVMFESVPFTPVR